MYKCKKLALALFLCGPNKESKLPFPCSKSGMTENKPAGFLPGLKS